MRKPLPLGEVSPKVTERASSSPKSIHTAIRTGFCQSDAIAVFLFFCSILALSGASRQLSQRESHWQTGPLSVDRWKLNIT